MLREESRRSKALKKNGAYIANGIKGNSSWMRTLFVIRERAPSNIVIPWIIITLNAVMWTLVLYYTDFYTAESLLKEETLLSLYPVILTTCLLLLVFRLNRAAVRWWETRRMWGVILEQTRILTSGLLEHVTPSRERDSAIKWTCTFMIASKTLLRGETTAQKRNNCQLFDDELAGILETDDLVRFKKCVEKGNHPGLFAAAEIRHAVKQGLGPVGEETPVSLAVARESRMRMFERSIGSLIANVGGMERVRSTPLPVIYITHLRTFIFVFLVFMPYIYGHLWGWATIPAVALVSYALLGIDGAAMECESPFKKNRVNHLAMEAYCALGFSNVLQLMMDSADRSFIEYVASTNDNYDGGTNYKVMEGREGQSQCGGIVKGAMTKEKNSQNLQHRRLPFWTM